MKPLTAPQGKKDLDFHNAQAAARKDVERAFGILEAQFAIVRGPAKFWDQKNHLVHHERLCDHAQHDHRE